MRDYVGNCESCHKEVFCENGFLMGVHEKGQLICFECAGKKKEENSKK